MLIDRSRERSYNYTCQGIGVGGARVAPFDKLIGIEESRGRDGSTRGGKGRGEEVGGGNEFLKGK